VKNGKLKPTDAVDEDVVEAIQANDDNESDNEIAREA
jgi:hypothetical protein